MDAGDLSTEVSKVGRVGARRERKRCDLNCHDDDDGSKISDDDGDTRGVV